MPEMLYTSLYYGDLNEYLVDLKTTGEAGYKTEKWKTLLPFLEQLSAQNAALIFIWEPATNRLIYAIDKKNIIGYDMARYTAPDGIQFSLSNVHADFLSCGMQMNVASMEYYLKQSPEDRLKTILNIDAEYKTGHGNYIHFLQQTVCIETGSDGHPLLFLTSICDITHIKKRRSANLTITGPGEIKMWNFNFDNQQLENIQPISAQEKKVLMLLSRGKSSKEIAQELFLSSHTIDTHRRNLLKRTDCLDTTGLVTYAKMTGLI